MNPYKSPALEEIIKPEVVGDEHWIGFPIAGAIYILVMMALVFRVVHFLFTGG